MKAVIFRQHGGPDVLEFTDVPEPAVGAGQVLVRVKVCALNHLDLWIRQGIPAYRIQLPHISGCDVAGIVERIGHGVTSLQAGERVVLMPGLSCGTCEACQAGVDNRCASYGIRGAASAGGYAERVVAEARDAYVLPESVGFEAAAAFPLVFLTAWHMLVTRAGLRAGETVLVQAAGSGVGHAAVQIAKHLGARVIATVGAEEKVAKAATLGADAVIQYAREDVELRVRQFAGPGGVNVVFEHVGPTTFERSLKALARGGRLVTCGASSGSTTPLDLRYVFSRELTLLGSMMGTRKEFETLLPLLVAGRLCPVVDTVFPLRDARAAQERLVSRAVFGKLVLAP